MCTRELHILHLMLHNVQKNLQQRTKQRKNVFNDQVKKEEQGWRLAGNSKRKLEHKLTEHILHVSVYVCSHANY